MSRTSRITAAALAACVLSPGAALAQGQDLRTPDSTPPVTPSQDLRAPDSMPQPAVVQDLRTPDSISQPAVVQDRRSPDAVDGHRTAPTIAPAPVVVAAPDGIDWTDAVIGAGLGAVLVLTLSGGVATVTRQRRRHITPA